jgi:hypothetical protein
MKKDFNCFLWALATFLFANTAIAQNPETMQTAETASRVAAFPWSENFNASTFPPAEWSKVVVTGGSYTWARGSYGNDVHQGAGAALHSTAWSASEDLLVTPPLEIPAEGDLTLKFWSRIGSPQGYSADLSYSEVMVSTTNTDAASFASVKKLSGTEVADSWQELSVSLAAYRGQTIYIAFRYFTTATVPSYYSHVWRLDDVKIAAAAPAIEAGALAFGTVYKNLPSPVTANYQIRNRGELPLTVTGAAEVSSNLTVDNVFPLLIPAGETATIPVTLDVAALPVGNLTGSFKLQCNDPEMPEATVSVTATVQAAAVISGYVYQDFTETNIWQPGWTFDRLARQAGEGIDNSPCVRVNLQFSSYYPTMGAASFTTPFIQMGANPVCSFNLQATNQSGGAPAAADALSYKLSITTDGINWTEIVTVNEGQHESQADYKLFATDVSAYAGKLCQVRFNTVTTKTTSIYVRLDNIIIGTEPSVDLSATAITGSSTPKEGVEQLYTVTVKNVGDAVGNYTVKLMQANTEGEDTELASTVITGEELAKDATADVSVAWTPAAPGSVSIYGKTVLAGDLDATNDNTTALTVNVQPANDLAAVSVNGNTTPTAGIASTYTVTMHNAGHLAQSAFTVKLMQANTEGEDAELGSQTVEQEITPDGSAEVSFAWTPSAAETVQLYGKVILDGDSNPANDQTDNLPVSVQPEGTLIISVGSETGTSYLPYNLFQRRSLSQSLYYPHEIGMIGGEISKIVYRARINSTGAVNDNIQNVPIKVWIGETDAADLAAGYIDPSTLTLIYDGVKSFPTGTYDVDIELIEPYQYKGGNLVVYSYVNNTVYGGYQDMFISSSYPNSSRSRQFYSDSEPNVAHPGALGEVYHGIPNTRFYGTPDAMSTMGSLSGVVTDADNVPVAGAKVLIAGTQYYATTGANGAYSFPLMAAGEYNIKVTKFGYLTETRTASVAASANTAIDVQLRLRSLFTVSGSVKRFDTDAAVAGASVTFNCENTHIYTATSAADGTFIFMDNETSVELYEGVYNVTVISEGLEDYAGQLNVNGNIENHEIVLYETLAPPVAPLAEVSDGKAVIEWLAPGAVPPFNSYIHYCVNDNVVWQAGSDGAYDITQAIRFTPDDLAQKGIVTGHSVSKIAIGVASNISNITAMELRIWEGGTSAANAGTLVYTQQVTNFASFGNNTMNDILLTAPFVIDASKELRIGYRITGTSGYPVGFDEGPGVEGRSNLLCINNIWQDATYQTDLNRNASIKAFVTDNPGGKGSAPVIPAQGNNSAAVQGTTVIAPSAQAGVDDILTERAMPEIAGNGGSKGFEKYVVYRLREDAPETEWTELAGDITALAYTDETYSELPYGVYQYAVKAQYTGNRLSPAALTNRLDKDMLVGYTVSLSLNTDETPAGAQVTLTCKDGNTQHVYTQTATGSSVVFNAVWRGAYDLTVSLTDFQPYSVSDIEINAAGLSHTAQLVEILYPVVNSVAAVTGSNAVVAWSEPRTFNEWITWNSTGDITGGTAGDPAGNDNLTAAVRFTAEDLSSFGVIAGQYITKVVLGVAHPGQVSQMAIQIWEGGSSVADVGTLAYTQEVTGYESFTEYTWVEIPLTAPFPIDPSKELRIGWQVTTTSSSASIHGHDASGSAPEWNEKTALFKSNYWGGVWRDVSQLLGGQFNNAIKAFVSNSPEGRQAMPLAYDGAETAAPASTAKAATGYTVYRFKAGDPETAWTQLGIAADTAYTDTQWATLPNDEYQYAVKARYAGEYMSEAVLTNPLTKTDIVYTVAVSANPIAGGNVSGGGENIVHGAEITVTATANEGYEFVNWTEDGMEVSEEAEYEFEVTANRTLVANFALEQFTVTFNTPEHGTLEVTAGGAPVASGSMVDYNTILAITATPDEGYELDVLTVNGAVFVSGNTYTAVADVEIVCTFKDNSGISGNTLTGITVYGNGNNVYIVNKNDIVLKSVQIADVLGRVVYDGKADSSVTIPVNSASGIYVVKLISDDNKVLSTKVHLMN